MTDQIDYLSSLLEIIPQDKSCLIKVQQILDMHAIQMVESLLKLDKMQQKEAMYKLKFIVYSIKDDITDNDNQAKEKLQYFIKYVQKQLQKEQALIKSKTIKNQQVVKKFNEPGFAQTTKFSTHKQAQKFNKINEQLRKRFDTKSYELKKSINGQQKIKSLQSKELNVNNISSPISSGQPSNLLQFLKNKMFQFLSSDQTTGILKKQMITSVPIPDSQEVESLLSIQTNKISAQNHQKN